jgi:hypothetical protein
VEDRGRQWRRVRISILTSSVPKIYRTTTPTADVNVAFHIPADCTMSAFIPSGAKCAQPT